MKSTRLRRIGAAILIFFTFAFSGGVLAKQHKTTSHTAQIKKTSVKHQASSKKEYSRNSEISGSLPDLRKYPSGTPRKKRFSGQ